jgi:hypothetical protein
MRDAAGRFAAEPLRKGGRFCRFHTILFPREPARACESIVVYIDLETNSLDVLSGKIVEIGALVDGSRATFSTVVHPGRDAPLDDASVHGIPHEELLSGPSFREAFARLDEFLRNASLSILESDDDSEDGRPPAVTMKQDLQVCLVAHNGASFDFPFLLSECVRASVGPAVMSSWIYVDTLDVLRATDRAGECKKLQCALALWDLFRHSSSRSTSILFGSLAHFNVPMLLRRAAKREATERGFYDDGQTIKKL